MLLTAKDVCRRLGISQATLDRWCADEEKAFPPSLKLGDGHRRWFPHHLAVWLVWRWKHAERLAKNEFPLPDPPDFASEMPTESQLAMLLAGETLERMAETAAKE